MAIEMKTVSTAAIVMTQLRRSDPRASLRKKLDLIGLRPVVGAARSSRTRRRSSSAITRLRMRSTISRSCVATTTVVPVRLMRSRSCMMPTDVSGSMLPVGSSASSSGGWLTKARATETRCCSPPEISVGRLLIFSPRPTRLRISGTLRRTERWCSPTTCSA